MDKAKMQAVAAQMNRLGEAWDAKADELVGLVNEGMLTADEAAKCLAGADLKEREAIKQDSGFMPGKGGSLDVARQAIDSRLPGYQGLSVKRHFSGD